MVSHQSRVIHGAAARPFKAAEAGRRHVVRSIEDACRDLDWKSEKRGSPYGLVCTKNQASYQRRARQRRHDLASLASLGAGPEATPPAGG
jgi:hypothetical protein